MKKKSTRKYIILECSECRISPSIFSESTSQKRGGVSRYLTSKSLKNTTEKLSLSKYCYLCRKHTSHKETKK